MKGASDRRCLAREMWLLREKVMRHLHPVAVLWLVLVTGMVSLLAANTAHARSDKIIELVSHADSGTLASLPEYWPLEKTEPDQIADLALKAWRLLLEQQFERSEAVFRKALTRQMNADKAGKGEGSTDSDPVQAARAVTDMVWSAGLETRPDLLARRTHFEAAIMGVARSENATEIARKAVAEAVALTPPAPAAESAAHLFLVWRLWGNSREEAGAELLKALESRKKVAGYNHVQVARILRVLGILQRRNGDFAKARAYYNESLAVLESLPGYPVGETDGDLADLLRDRAVLYRREGEYGQAEADYRRAVDIQGRFEKEDRIKLAGTLNNLATLLTDLGRFHEATLLHRRAIPVREAFLGPFHLSVARELMSLAHLFIARKRPAHAFPVLERVAGILTENPDADPGLTARMLGLRGRAFETEGNFKDAETAYRLALGIWQKLEGLDHPDSLEAMRNLAAALRFQEKFEEGEKLLQSALEKTESRYGPDHPETATARNDLAGLLRDRKQFDAARKLYLQSLENLRGRFGADHPEIALVLHNLARTALEEGRLDLARQRIDQAADIGEHRIATGQDISLAPEGGDSAAERASLREIFLDSARIYALSWQEAGVPEDARAKSFAEASFQALQMARGMTTASAVARMSARFATGQDRLASLVRERQTAVGLYSRLDRELEEVLSRPADERDPAREQALRDRMVVLESRIATSGTVLEEEFPDYLELVNPKPLSIASTQLLLNPGEAVLLTGTGPKASVVMLLRPDSYRLHVVPVRSKELEKAVQALRGGLDPVRVTRNDRGLEAFSLDQSYDLYRRLLAPVMDGLDRVRHIFHVPDGALQSLPVGVLVASPPPAGGGETDAMEAFRNADWLALKHGFSVLPAVQALRALRRFAKRAHGKRPFLGIGDPLLRDHPDGDKGLRAAACSQTRGVVTGDASEVQSKEVAEISWKTASQPWAFRSSGNVEPAALFQGPGGMADPCTVASLTSLPDTAVELGAINEILGGAQSRLMLQDEAREHFIRESRDLDEYQVIAFATHGITAGELEGMSEPALVLTPPEEASPLDDGLLTATEISGLSLDADWVLLSACNTAAPDGQVGSDNLSGLARAFFHAGARALYVSHWQVVSDATTELTREMLMAWRTGGPDGQGLEKAEAHRRAMEIFVRKPAKPEWSHPLFWAPFVIVGEGGAGQPG